MVFLIKTILWTYKFVDFAMNCCTKYLDFIFVVMNSRYSQPSKIYPLTSITLSEISGGCYNFTYIEIYLRSE